MTNDLLTDHMGICDLEYGEVKKIVDQVLHQNKTTSLPCLPEAGENDTVAAEAKEEEEEQDEESSSSPTKEKKKGIVQRLSSLKKVLRNQ